MHLQNRFLNAALLTLIAAIYGCAPDTDRAPTASEQQDAILKNPSDYKPSFGRDVTNGNITTLDQKGLNRDLDDAFNP